MSMVSNVGSLSNLRLYTLLRDSTKVVLQDFIGSVLDTFWSPVLLGASQIIKEDFRVKLRAEGVTNDDSKLCTSNLPLPKLSNGFKSRYMVAVKVKQLTDCFCSVSLNYDSTHAIGFRFDTTVGGNWHTFSKDGAVTVNDSGVAVITDKVKLEVVIVSTTQIDFYIDDVLVDSIITNIDTAHNFAPVFYIKTTDVGGLLKDMEVYKMLMMFDE